MIPLIEKQRPHVVEVCRRLHVRRLELFGSAARDDFDPSRSDIDLLVEFEPDSSVPALEAYFGLKEALEALFGRRVDLVMPGAVRNPYVQADIERSRRLLYAA
ncbi:MAG: nucleotidyltransferase domain-containing protein [Betaproteobacteria bacterium]|nr:nucleotidyltransferase domain-containing protein [Betaproteobacteria bacterium]